MYCTHTITCSQTTIKIPICRNPSSSVRRVIEDLRDFDDSYVALLLFYENSDRDQIRCFVHTTGVVYGYWAGGGVIAHHVKFGRGLPAFFSRKTSTVVCNRDRIWYYFLESKFQFLRS